MNEKRKVYYGWVIVAAGVLICIAGMGFTVNLMALFISPVSEALHVGRSTFSAHSTFFSVGQLVMYPILGRLFARAKHPRRYMTAGAVCGCLCLFLYSVATKVWQFYLISLFSGLTTNLLTIVPMNNLLSKWFVDKRGLAAGITFAGSGVGPMIISPILASVIENHGWRTGYLSLAIVFFFFTLPPVLFVLKDKPEDMGLTALGQDRHTDKTTRTVIGLTREEAVKTRAFWFLGAALMLGSMVCMGVQANIISYLGDIGYTAERASLIYSLVMGVLCIGKLVLGAFFDKYGVKVSVVYMCSAFLVSVVFLLLAQAPAFAVIFALIFGLADAMLIIPGPIIVGKFFGNRDYSSIMGLTSAFGSAGTALGVPLMALIYDRTGSYRPAWFFAFLLGTVTLLLYLLAVKSSRRRGSETA